MLGVINQHVDDKDTGLDVTQGEHVEGEESLAECHYQQHYLEQVKEVTACYKTKCSCRDFEELIMGDKLWFSFVEESQAYEAVVVVLEPEHGELQCRCWVILTQ